MRSHAPRSWIFVGLDSDFAPGTVTDLDLCDSPRVAYRTARGSLVVADAHCPHVGTHLGQGATIEGESIRCPLHGMRFDVAGRCLQPAEGGPRLRVHPIRTVAGLVFTWYDPEDRPPRFELPELDDSDYLPYRIRIERIALAMEDPLEVHAVDVAHNRTLHGEEGVETIDPFETDASSTRSSLVMRHPATAAGRRMLKLIGVADGLVETRVAVHTVGLGYQHIQSTVAAMNLVVNQFMLCVPRGANEVDLHVVYSMRRLGPEARRGLIRWLPLTLIERIFERGGYGELMAATDEHLRMWTRKRQLRSPGLLPGETELRRYRSWVDRFYD